MENRNHKDSLFIDLFCKDKLDGKKNFKKTAIKKEKKEKKFKKSDFSVIVKKKVISPSLL